MKIEITKNQAIEALLNDNNANWSIEGATFLVDFLEENFADFLFDVTAIRCDFTEIEAEEAEEEGFHAEQLLTVLKNGNAIYFNY